MGRQFLPKVRIISASGSLLHAFTLVLDVVDHPYGNLEGCIKASGVGDIEEPSSRWVSTWPS
jgi:hypothetical protein